MLLTSKLFVLYLGYFQITLNRKFNSNGGKLRSELGLFDAAATRYVCQRRPARWICHLHAVPLGHVADIIGTDFEWTFLGQSQNSIIGICGFSEANGHRKVCAFVVTVYPVKICQSFYFDTLICPAFFCAFYLFYRSVDKDASKLRQKDVNKIN